MNKKNLQGGAIFLFIAVALGAYGAHGLASMLSDSQLNTFETGVRYQFYHGLALLTVGIIYNFSKNKLVKWAGWLFAVGIICFSGSIYLLACREVLGISHWAAWLGPVTPIGGLFFLAGWTALFFGIRNGSAPA